MAIALVVLVPMRALAEPNPPEVLASTEPVVEEPEETVEIIEKTAPGSQHGLDEKDLDRFEQDDIHAVLAVVPGVYFREEDGFGLRPNIGMRGTNPERSAKVALLEDGLPIAPAPYAAPAAYYFPLVTRMAGIEIEKGPRALLSGPNTVGGSINMISADVRPGQHGAIDIAGGEYLYGKGHIRVGHRTDNFGFFVEGVRLQSQGFKELDGGGDTGFTKHDGQLKLFGATDPASNIYHSIEFRLGFADETSNATYTGLALADYDDSPYRRYASTQLGQMNWDHMRWVVRHKLEIGQTKITTSFYRNSFNRSWRKLNQFADGAQIRDILANPTAGNNPIYYDVLTGAMDSSGLGDDLIVGTNDRQFTSGGVQVDGSHEFETSAGRHSTRFGIRAHTDQVHRNHFEDPYAMQGGQLVPTVGARVVTNNSMATAKALAAWGLHRWEWHDLAVEASTRVELVKTGFKNNLTGMNDADRDVFAVLPGLGAQYRVAPSVSILAGAYRGFIPVAPGSDPSVDPETSISGEFGSRFERGFVHAELIGFATRHQNLKGTCSISSGCMGADVGREFNGGIVNTFGVEAFSAATVPVGSLSLPLKLAYTFTDARFQEQFSSSNPQWGNVVPGDHLPYLAAHQLTLEAGIAQPGWEIAARLHVQSEMRDSAGSGALDDGDRIPGYSTVHLSGHYNFSGWGTAYVTVNNVFNQAYIVSLRPLGARPGSPRIATIGYKNQF